MTPDRTEFCLEEYKALRATIRERGTMRLIVTAITFVAWAALALTLISQAVVPALGLIPLVVLVAGFEVIFALHVGVERVGRFLQVHYETPGTLPGWETTAMGLGKQPGGTGGLDALFGWVFAIAALLNFATSALLASSGLEGTFVELLVIGLIHLVFVIRLLNARRFAASQRQRDLEWFSK
jgi:hypothetical protein